MRRVNVGGKNRVGSGGKIKTNLREFERSTFDLSYRWKSSMAIGTITPFMTEVALPGDTFDIYGNLSAMTGPTVGPLFGMLHGQMDFYQVPMRLYQAQMHNNKNGIGLDMATYTKLPQLEIVARNPITDDGLINLDNYQINASHLLSYLDIRGLGIKELDGSALAGRRVNAIPYIGYYDICKNFYCNKQEEVGYIVHSQPIAQDAEISVFQLQEVIVNDAETTLNVVEETDPKVWTDGYIPQTQSKLLIVITGVDENTVIDVDRISMVIRNQPTVANRFKLSELFKTFSVEYVPGMPNQYIINGKDPILYNLVGDFGTAGYKFDKESLTDLVPQLREFPLSDIDDLREDILSKIKETTPYIIKFDDDTSDIPDSSVFKLPLSYTLNETDGRVLSSSLNQKLDGLCVKTYQSDKLNNWLNSEQIGLVDTISAIKVETTEVGEVVFVNEINIKQKVWEMFNAIQTSGGSLLDYYDAVYDEEVYMGIYSPVYCGGSTSQLRFQEINSTAQSADQPLGTLAGKGILTNEKNGKITIKVTEPSFIMGVVSWTPILDYSQGNAWWLDIESIADLHSPYLDQIGFQNLLTDEMYWADTKITGAPGAWAKTTYTAGKQTAWIQYQTNINKVRGNFADQNEQMFMVLDRRYELQKNGNRVSIKDVTTYIDPAKYNYIFADLRRDAQNIWAQIDVSITARRKMSSKVQPMM